MRTTVTPFIPRPRTPAEELPPPPHYCVCGCGLAVGDGDWASGRRTAAIHRLPRRPRR